MLLVYSVRSVTADNTTPLRIAYTTPYPKYSFSTAKSLPLSSYSKTMAKVERRRTVTARIRMMFLFSLFILKNWQIPKAAN